MRNTGGVDCATEFASFLSANPQYIEVESPENGGPEFSQLYICIDGGIRYFDNAPVTPFEQFLQLLSTNANFRGLTDTGLTALGANPPDGSITLFNPGTGFFIFEVNFPEFGVFAYYDVTQISADYTTLFANNPSWTLTT